jgi:hypothetical protein
MTLRADHPYTATDPASGVTADSLRAWREHRPMFSKFVRADLAVVGDQAGPPYADSGSGPVHPTLVFIDDCGRTLALNGTACGFEGEGPRGTARILAEEGLLPAAEAMPVVVAVVDTATLTRMPPRVIDLRHSDQVRDTGSAAQ